MTVRPAIKLRLLGRFSVMIEGETPTRLLLALFRHGAMSDLSPQCAAKRTLILRSVGCRRALAGKIDGSDDQRLAWPGGPRFALSQADGDTETPKKTTGIAQR
jgi:hypothetical protein